jgi:outer membrane protein TolC
LCLLIPAATRSQTTDPIEGSGRRTLREAVEHALATHPVVRAERYKVQRAELAVKEVKNKKRPSIDLEVRTGLVPQAKGDIFDSPDSNEDLNNLGVFYRLDLKIAQPLTTFGKIASARAAAEQGVLIREFGRDFTAAKLGFQVVQAFWGFESANRGANLAEDLQKDYETLLDEVERAANDPDSDVDDTRLFEVQSFEYEIKAAGRQSVKNQEISGASLEVLLGWGELDPDSFAPVGTPGLPDEDMLDPLIAIAMDSSPPIRQARAGLGVLDSKLALAEASRWPDIFLALGGAYARAPNRTDIRNPFILDPFNLRTIGGFLGLRWNLKFADHRLAISQSSVERQEAIEQLSVLEDRMVIEVTRAYAEAKALSDLLGAAMRSKKAAKRWLRLSGDNWDLGLGSVDRLVDAYGQYYELGAIVIEQEARYQLALARLALTLGRIELYLEWIEHETVEIS